MTVIIHQASDDKKLLQHATFEPCPFCGSETIRVCATPSSTAIACNKLHQCGAEIYFNGPPARAIERWNRRQPRRLDIGQNPTLMVLNIDRDPIVIDDFRRRLREAGWKDEQIDALIQDLEDDDGSGCQAATTLKSA